jgi:hypothetical protein
MSRADLYAESFTGTIWSSSPCRTSVGTSNLARSPVKSVSENASMQPHGAFLRIRGQLRRPGQEHGLRDVAAALFRSRRGALQAGCDILIRDDGGRGAVPRRLVRVPVLPGDAGQRAMDLAPITGGGPFIDRGADQRVPERHPRLNRDDVLRYRGIGVAGSQAKQGGGPP